jgi:uncharacterized protein (TIGR03066 family)
MKTMTTLAMAMVAVLAFIGCGQDSAAGPGSSWKPATNDTPQAPAIAVERLLGIWNAKDGRTSMTFRKNDEMSIRFLVNENTVSVYGTYKITASGITLQADASERGKDTSLFTSYSVAIQDEMLILTGPDGKTTAWVRMPAPAGANS